MGVRQARHAGTASVSGSVVYTATLSSPRASLLTLPVSLIAAKPDEGPHSSLTIGRARLDLTRSGRSIGELGHDNLSGAYRRVLHQGVRRVEERRVGWPRSVCRPEVFRCLSGDVSLPEPIGAVGHGRRRVGLVERAHGDTHTDLLKLECDRVVREVLQGSSDPVVHLVDGTVADRVHHREQACEHGVPAPRRQHTAHKGVTR
eukprot:scaffold98623_cov99-Phaeocystis_antarctica.AAC.1